MKYRVYPPGYNPFFDPKGKTREEIQRQELLASLARTVEQEPTDGRWYYPVQE